MSEKNEMEVKKQLWYGEIKTVGHIIDKTYHTNRTPETFMRKYKGFGISADILAQLIRNGISKVAIHYDGKTEKSIFHTTVEDFIEKGIVDNPTNDLSDRQYFLSIDFMVKELRSN